MSGAVASARLGVERRVEVERVGRLGGRLFVPGGSATLALEPTDTLYLYAPLDTQAR